MAHSAAVGVRLAEARHLHRAHHAALNALTFHGVLHRDGVDRRAEHAHVIRIDGGHLRRRALTAAPDVARADHDGDFRARFVKLADHVGHTVDLLKIKQAAVVAQRFAAELDENALILCHGVSPLRVFKKRGDACACPCVGRNYFFILACSAAMSAARLS